MAPAPASVRTNWSGECMKLCRLAGPVILALVFQFLITLVTAALVGHIGKVELAAVSIVNGVIQGFAFGLLVRNNHHRSLQLFAPVYTSCCATDRLAKHVVALASPSQLGMGSALETLCGQAVAARQFQMLGVYMQRFWIICLATSLALLPLYIFTSPILRLLRQSAAISAVSGRYARWCAPQLFAYAVNFPIQKFYQAQQGIASSFAVMTAISGAVLAAHALLNWVVVARLGRGMLGAALVGDASWWLLNAAQFVYLVSGSSPLAWTGFSRKAFANLGGFHELSALDVDGCSWLQCRSKLFHSISFLVSVRVSNELGANHPKAAKFSVVVATTTSAAIGLIFTAVTLAARKQMPRLFTDDGAVIKETAKLGYLLAATIFLNSIQPVLSGMAIGAGWQSLVAFVNIGCYYLVGLPLAAVFGFKLKLNATGIWVGVLIGTVLQTVILFVIVVRTKWQKEVAEERIRVWGGNVELPRTQETGATENIAEIFD
ncbi:hypothetical protein HU200_055163 [Digitaria exilis]|uniref:Protein DETOXIFICATION n=1 Tax=Digitaria exilis TaxID=1010633 RepID=A0A835E6Y7_9POAL|nr:hypothetical protein HU200_055163 [Digitaria exilis]